ncbi:MAG: thioredoxin domain-containing protein [Siculibacillus sp.]|nr:thioredoxin domain-containing protein [Siculibacillus sp.]
MTPSRRRFLECSAALLAGGSIALAAGPAMAQGVHDVAELMKPGPLPDMSLGKADAPITVVEYSSMTCGHCANFHKNVFPYLKEKYVDTGKVLFVHREFPLDPLAAAASMLVRCSPKEKYYDMLSLFFDQQAVWVTPNDPVAALRKLTRQVGFSEESFKACLTDQKMLDDLTEIRRIASEKFRVDGTPAFFVNGRAQKGISTKEELDKALAPFLK